MFARETRSCCARTASSAPRGALEKLSRCSLAAGETRMKRHEFPILPRRCSLTFPPPAVSFPSSSCTLARPPRCLSLSVSFFPVSLCLHRSRFRRYSRDVAAIFLVEIFIASRVATTTRYIDSPRGFEIRRDAVCADATRNAAALNQGGNITYASTLKDLTASRLTKFRMICLCRLKGAGLAKSD